MSPEFRASERDVRVSDPCMYCGCDADAFATDGETGKSVCRTCCLDDRDEHSDNDPSRDEEIGEVAP